MTTARRSTAALHRLHRFGRAAAVVGAGLDLRRDAGWLRDRADADIPGARSRIYAEMWRSAAAVVGASVGDVPGGFLRVTRGGSSGLLFHNQVPLDDAVVLQLAADRRAAHALLADAGVAVPGHVVIGPGELHRAEFFLREVGTCVVKPARSTGGGTGVTCGVTSGDDLLRAHLRALRWDDVVVVEEAVGGAEVRMLLLDGRVIAAVERRPPEVVGDGRSTIADLMEAENDRRVSAGGRAGLWRITVDLDCVLTLRKHELALRSVPPAGAIVAVKTAVNQNSASGNRTITDLGRDLQALGERAAETLGLRLAAVEAVVGDDGPVVIEVNGSPGLHYHYLVADGSTVPPVAEVILEAMLSRRRSWR